MKLRNHTIKNIGKTSNRKARRSKFSSRFKGALTLLGLSALLFILPACGSTPLPGLDYPDGGCPTCLTDGGLQPETHEIKTLVGDEIDKNLLDRGRLIGVYSMGPDTSSSANPFSDGTENGYLADAPGTTKLHKISETDFTPLTSYSIPDNNALLTYTEIQNLWINGKVTYVDSLDNIAADLGLITYSVKFSGQNDMGIPVCTQATNSVEYANCEYFYRTDTHKLEIMFLGEKWTILEMNNPTTEITSEEKLVSGGSVRLAKESSQGILKKGESLREGDLKFVLDDVARVDTHSATISIYAVNGSEETLLRQVQIDPGSTLSVDIPGHGIRKLHIYQTAPGYTFNSTWADIAVLSKEITLESGSRLTGDEYYAVLGWKNRGASSSDTVPDHLRTIILYLDSSSDILGDRILPGQFVPITSNNTNWTLTFGGLDIDDSQRVPLKFDLENYNIKTVQNAAVLGESNSGLTCTIYPPYVKATSSTDNNFVLTYNNSSAKIARDNEFYIATNGASCDEGTTLAPGSLFMKANTSSVSQYTAVNYTGPIGIRYPTASEGEISSWETGGMIYVANANDAMTSYPFNSYDIPVSPDADFLFGISERAGTGISWNTSSVMLFGLQLDGTNSTLNFDGTATSTNYFYKDHVYTVHAGPAYPSNYTEEEGTITERGSRFVSKDETSVLFKIAKKLGLARFFLKTKENQ